MKRIRVAILHDFFSSVGGGEKVVLSLAQKYNADIFTYFVEDKKTFKEIKNFNIVQSKFPIKYKLLRQFMAKRFFKSLKLDYDIYLMYGFYSIFAGLKNKPSIWMSGAPPKNLFLKDYYNNSNIFKKFGLWIFRKLMMGDNIKAVKSMDLILSVSEFQKININEIYGLKNNVEVVYPAVETTRFYNKPAEDFYLTVSRLEPLKRVDIIVEAFKKLPEKKLVIVGDGSQKKYLENLAKDSKNIIFKGAIYGDELTDLYARCIAFVFMSKLEDYGIVPVEAMAAGKPVIGVNEGGVKETVLNGKTGLLINPSVDELVNSINSMTGERAEKMKNDCIKRAKMFDESAYFKQIEDVINKVTK